MMKVYPYNIILLATLMSAMGGTVHASNPSAKSPFFVQKYATNIVMARGLIVDDVGDLLVSHTNSITALYDTDNGTGTVRVNRVQIVNASGLRLSHGIAFHDGYLYASSPTTVYRWPYTSGQRSLITVPAETVVHTIPGNGHHTRTLVVDSQSVLYVHIGSGLNVDPNSERARIRTFPLTTIPNGGYEFRFGGVFADGLRNEVGLGFDSNGILWGVENAADELERPDLGEGIYNGNPAEELNKFDKQLGKHYGYPWCFSSHNLTGYPAGTQFAWPSTMGDGVHDDAWCNNPANNQPPALAMPAHEAPLGIQFFKPNMGCDSVEGSFPCSSVGDAIVAFHGSWNSDIPVGYRVSQINFDKVTGDPTGEIQDILFEPNKIGCANLGNCFKPVNAVFDKNGHLLVSDDEAGEIFRIYYNSTPPQIIDYVLM